jgi:hypothetical protein
MASRIIGALIIANAQRHTASDLLLIWTSIDHLFTVCEQKTSTQKQLHTQKPGNSPNISHYLRF